VQLYDISLKGLQRRRGRMLLLLLSLATAVATVVTLVTITRSMNHAVAHRLDEYGANIVIVPQTSDLALSYGGISVATAAYDVGTLTLADLEPIASIPNARNISVVAPKLLTAVDLGGRQALMAGVLFSEEVRLKQWWQVHGAYPGSSTAAATSSMGGHVPASAPAGGALGTDEALLGARLAEALGLSPGDTLSVQGRTVQVAGVLEENGSQDDQILFVDLALAQELTGRPHQVSLVEI
jgi:putative ABC transport system permease protein